MSRLWSFDVDNTIVESCLPVLLILLVTIASCLLVVLILTVEIVLCTKFADLGYFVGLGLAMFLVELNLC